jgi:hypothetical protein
MVAAMFPYRAMPVTPVAVAGAFTGTGTVRAAVTHLHSLPASFMASSGMHLAMLAMFTITGLAPAHPRTGTVIHLFLFTRGGFVHPM